MFVFQAVLSASPVLSQEDLRRFALGVSPQWDTECDQLLHTAVSRLACRDEPRGHVVLILDKVGFVISIKYCISLKPDLHIVGPFWERKDLQKH